MKKFFTGLMMAWGCFTTIPCPKKIWDEEARGYMLFTLPLVGLLLGFIWWGIFLLLWEVLFVPKILTACILVLVPALLSGCIHVDGYMDCCDAIFSRRPLDEKLRILKDSSVGAFACIGLVGLVALAICSMYVALDNTHNMLNLIAIPMISRYASVMSIWTSPSLKTSQYTVMEEEHRAKENKRLSTWCCILAIIILIAFFFICDRTALTRLCTSFELVLLVELVVHLIVCLFARKQLGGMSGDVSGFAICISEVAAILTLALI